MEDYNYIMDAIMKADIPSLNEIAAIEGGFPTGRDAFIHREWITNGIDCGDLAVVKWMLGHGAPVVFDSDEGYTVLHSALERDKPDRYDILSLLITAGADVNAYGIHDYTPAHMAAVRNDVQALRLLIDAGADLSLRTRIDDYTTPLEEAIHIGRAGDAVSFLKSIHAPTSR